MAKQKNTNNIQQPVGTEPKSLGYAGTIKVQIRKGKTIISTKQFKNNGSTELFKFFGYCLQGDFETAENYRPNKIMLFHNEGTTVEEGRTKAKIENAKQCSQYITKSDLPSIIWEKTEETATVAYKDDLCKVTLHFVVPSLYLIKNGDINQICLYSKTKIDQKTCSAYYLCVDETGTSWDPILTELQLNQDINIIIDWTMTVSNK